MKTISWLLFVIFSVLIITRRAVVRLEETSPNSKQLAMAQKVLSVLAVVLFVLFSLSSLPIGI